MSQPERLSDFDYRAASVLPYTKWPNNPHIYFLLSREAYGSDAGTWDAFGGLRDSGETHPVQTAAREFSEETSLLVFSNEATAIKYITLAADHTSVIIANRAKRGVVYITYFSARMLSNLFTNFFTTRERLKKRKDAGHLVEKNGLAWVDYDYLSSAIATAPRTPTGRLILPVLVKARVLTHNGNLVEQDIELRPVLVNLLQSYFTGRHYESGRDDRIRYYNR